MHVQIWLHIHNYWGGNKALVLKVITEHPAQKLAM